MSEAAGIVEHMDDPLFGETRLATVPELVACCLALGTGPLSRAESDFIREHTSLTIPAEVLTNLARQITAGYDPLGAAYTNIRTPAERRPLGQTYTPEPIIAAMVGWAKDRGTPTRVVDPGAGSGRFLLAAGRAFPNAELHAAEIDPLATLMLRANATVTGMNNRTTIHLGDYRTMRLSPVTGTTLFIGNPPYVRHHLIAPEWKQWLQQTAHQRGLTASGLAGLHAHFFLATAEHGRPGDMGAFITSSEWLDVNYGRLIRQLLLNDLGGVSVHVLDPTVSPFADATTTGTITCFTIGAPVHSMRIQTLDEGAELGHLRGGRDVSRAQLATSHRWSVLTRDTPKLPSGFVELGELCRVHRGTVTGANKVWVLQQHADLPGEVLFPSVTKARELFTAGERLTASTNLHQVVDLPVDLDVFSSADRQRIDRFLRHAQALGADQGYVATNRRAWWSIGLREPAPILATYMARRPPAFVRNEATARHINIAHGLYPRQPLSAAVLDALTAYLRRSVALSQGRTYAGGLVKFEPKEMERLPVPTLEMLIEQG